MSLSSVTLRDSDLYDKVHLDHRDVALAAIVAYRVELTLGLSEEILHARESLSKAQSQLATARAALGEIAAKAKIISSS